MPTPANGTEIQPLVKTVGRRSGQPRTVRIRIYYWNGRMIATSPYPRIKRDWVQNVVANPRVTIEAGDRLVKARAKLLEQEFDTKANIAMRRISWRTSHCPVLQASTDTFVEFFPESPPEDLYAPDNVTHNPAVDPLAGPTLAAVEAWQQQGKYYTETSPYSRPQPAQRG